MKMAKTTKKRNKTPRKQAKKTTSAAIGRKTKIAALKPVKPVEKSVEKTEPAIVEKAPESPVNALSNKVVVVIVHYNTPGYLSTCMTSLLEQTYRNLEIVFIDNNSPDKEGLELMHKHFDMNEQVRIIANTENKGYAKAANQGIRIALSRGAKYVSIANPDIVFTPDYFEKVIGRMSRDPKIASITGKIYLYDFANNKPTDVIDSTGFFAYRNRRIVDAGQGMIDNGQFDKEKEVFGVSGACPLYRVEALEDVKILDEYFDEDFFMYKEDVDLSWRMLLYGWKSLFYPHAFAYHGRGTSGALRITTKQILENRKRLSRMQKKLSFRNQLLMQEKNELWSNFFHDFAPIMLVKILMPFYITFVEPYLWLAYFQYLKLLPRIWKKRSIIMKNKHVDAKEMGKWFKRRKELLNFE